MQHFMQSLMLFSALLATYVTMMQILQYIFHMYHNRDYDGSGYPDIVTAFAWAVYYCWSKQ
jgi:response regulator RpfG family c-di-GMP phosphodiesterase